MTGSTVTNEHVTTALHGGGIGCNRISECGCLGWRIPVACALHTGMLPVLMRHTFLFLMRGIVSMAACFMSATLIIMTHLLIIAILGAMLIRIDVCTRSCTDCLLRRLRAG
jgi:hypothetical protein